MWDDVLGVLLRDKGEIGSSPSALGSGLVPVCNERGCSQLGPCWQTPRPQQGHGGSLAVGQGCGGPGSIDAAERDIFRALVTVQPVHTPSRTNRFNLCLGNFLFTIYRFFFIFFFPKTSLPTILPTPHPSAVRTSPRLRSCPGCPALGRCHRGGFAGFALPVCACTGDTSCTAQGHSDAMRVFFPEQQGAGRARWR